jgi:leucine dehydrogenase
MLHVTRLTVPGYSDVLRGADPETGYVGFIAAHGSGAVPALGGTRMMAYASQDDALADALRLASAMSLKVHAAGMPARGGKAVIMDAAAPDRDAILRSHAALVNELGGSFITAVDVGTSTHDMRRLQEMTPHVTSLNVGPWTALGVVHGIRSALSRVGTRIDSAVVAVQGCGQVGLGVVEQLLAAGATVRAADVNPSAAAAAAAFGAEIVDPERIHTLDCDVFSPCALGGVLNPESVRMLRCRAIAGAANNQLTADGVATLLHDRGIIYVPDFVANAGGVISGFGEVRGWSEDRIAAAVAEIAPRIDGILERAHARGVSPLDIVLEDIERAPSTAAS